LAKLREMMAKKKSPYQTGINIITKRNLLW
jgi:hypothetical protein